MKYNFFFLSLLSLLLFSCKSDKTVKEETPTICYYTYDEESSNLEWTAFKTTGKVPVAGSFNEMEVSAEEGNTPKEVLESIEFKISTSSVETNNVERNGKIADKFFGTINTTVIEGKVKDLQNNGKAVVSIKMNNKSVDVVGDYNLNGEKFDFHSTINLADWDAQSGVDALNTACKELHTGDDKISKLWSEVELKFSTVIKSNCE